MARKTITVAGKRKFFIDDAAELAFQANTFPEGAMLRVGMVRSPEADVGYVVHRTWEVRVEGKPRGKLFYKGHRPGEMALYWSEKNDGMVHERPWVRVGRASRRHDLRDGFWCVVSEPRAGDPRLDEDQNSRETR